MYRNAQRAGYGNVTRTATWRGSACKPQGCTLKAAAAPVRANFLRIGVGHEAILNLCYIQHGTFSGVPMPRRIAHAAFWRQTLADSDEPRKALTGLTCGWAERWSSQVRFIAQQDDVIDARVLSDRSLYASLRRA